MNYFITEQALQALLQTENSDDWPLRLPLSASAETLDIFSTDIENTRFFIHREDHTDTCVCLFASDAQLSRIPERGRRTALQRMHRFALASHRLPLHLPPDWSEFHFNNLTAFFAVPWSNGTIRWIAQYAPISTRRDVAFLELTTEDKPILLQDYHVDATPYLRATSAWTAAARASEAFFAAHPRAPTTASLQPAVDLAAVSFGAIAKHATFSQWRARLTEDQERFFYAKTDHSIRLRGPAGTGKTLTLAMKALHELTAHDDSTIRILFVTHSWALAEQIDALLHTLDESGVAGKIEVLPLVAIARSKLPAERFGEGFRLLGEDSLSGRRLQLERIDAIVEEMIRDNWLAFKRGVSSEFAERALSPRGSDQKNAFIWDIMNEFASVLSAQAILPGINAERKYLALERIAWMMPLKTDDEKRFILAVYTAFVGRLASENFLTSDQLINDFINYLETFTWNLKRKSDGYDLIFVDELHLFTEQERLALTYLGRDPNRYPTVFMALDPRQSPMEVYAEFKAGDLQGRDSGEAERDLGETESMELRVIHRFSPQILDLLRHINNSYPTLGLGDDWQLDLNSVSATGLGGGPPLLMSHSSRDAEMETILQRAAETSQANPAEKIAVILGSPLQTEAFAQKATELGVRHVAIRGRDDTETLRYAKRAVAICAAEYAAGLQFDTVLIGAISVRKGVANQGHQLRRLLSTLYLAISRAANRVEIHANDEDGGAPDVVSSAVTAGVITRVPG